MRTVPKSAYVVGAITVVVLSFWTTLVMLDRFSSAPPPTRAASSVNTPPTNINDLPKIAKSGTFPALWVELLGLSVSAESMQSVIPGQPVLKLVAASTKGGHRLEMKVGSLEKNNIYVAAIWIKPAMQTRVFVQIHDDGSQNPTNYGVIFADLSNQKIYNVQHVVSPTIQTASDGWLKLQVPLRTADGSLSIMLGLLDNNDSTLYQGDGQSALLFGGIETLPQG